MNKVIYLKIHGNRQSINVMFRVEMNIDLEHQALQYITILSVLWIIGHKNPDFPLQAIAWHFGK